MIRKSLLSTAILLLMGANAQEGVKGDLTTPIQEVVEIASTKVPEILNEEHHDEEEQDEDDEDDKKVDRKFIKKLEKLREKLVKSEHSEDFYYDIIGYIKSQAGNGTTAADQLYSGSSECDYTCAQNCFASAAQNSTMTSTYLQCIFPTCSGCSPFYRLDFLKDQIEDGDLNVTVSEHSLKNHTEYFKQYDLNNENLTKENYTLSQCDYECAKEQCLEMKKDVPFQVILACYREMCGCKFNLNDPMQEQILGEKVRISFPISQNVTEVVPETPAVPEVTPVENTVEVPETPAAPISPEISAAVFDSSAVTNLSSVGSVSPTVLKSHSSNDFYSKLQKELQSPYQERKMHEYRHEMDKYRYKWLKYQYTAGANGWKDECDYNCASECFNAPGVTDQSSAQAIFYSCIVPKCKCIKTLFNDKQQYIPVVSPTLTDSDEQEDAATNLRAEIDEINADILDPSIDEDIDPEEQQEASTMLGGFFNFGSTPESTTQAISAQAIVPQAVTPAQMVEKNPYIDSCNLMCHKDCLRIKKPAPFPILELCAKDKCKCDHAMATAHPPKQCNTQCRNKCLEDSKYYMFGGQNNNPTIVDCIVECGCEEEMKTNLQVSSFVQKTMTPTKTIQSPIAQQAAAQTVLISEKTESVVASIETPVLETPVLETPVLETSVPETTELLNDDSSNEVVSSIPELPTILMGGDQPQLIPVTDFEAGSQIAKRIIVCELILIVVAFAYLYWMSHEDVKTKKVYQRQRSQPQSDDNQFINISQDNEMKNDKDSFVVVQE